MVPVLCGSLVVALAAP
nr:hypothetical protein [Vibrio cholerae]